MIVKMKSGAEYLISDARGEKLKQLLKNGPAKEFINLDGNGMMVATRLIISVEPDRPKTEKESLTDAWKDAIRHNLKVMRETGRMGHATADDFLPKPI